MDLLRLDGLEDVGTAHRVNGEMEIEQRCGVFGGEADSGSSYRAMRLLGVPAPAGRHTQGGEAHGAIRRLLLPALPWD